MDGRTGQALNVSHNN